MNVNVSKLSHHPLNSKIYSLSSLDDLISSIEEFGLLQPLVINQRNEVVSGNREPTYFHMDTSLKDAMRQIADYRHATLSNLIEEGARLLVSNESARMREDMHKVNAIRDMMRL